MILEDPVIITTKSLLYTVDYGASITLNCRVEGVIMGIAIWVKESVVVSRILFSSLNTKQFSYTIENATASDEGTYTCGLIDSFGSQQNITFSVDVKTCKSYL